jgi:hypothetical protein
MQFSQPMIELLNSTAEALEIDFRAYSGRGMYGRQCISVTTNRQDFITLISTVVGELMELCTDPANVDQVETYKDEACALVSYESDSMGLDTVYYWPDFEWEGYSPQ